MLPPIRHKMRTVPDDIREIAHPAMGSIVLVAVGAVARFSPRSVQKFSLTLQQRFDRTLNSAGSDPHFFTFARLFLIHSSDLHEKTIDIYIIINFIPQIKGEKPEHRIYNTEKTQDRPPRSSKGAFRISSDPLRIFFRFFG